MVFVRLILSSVATKTLKAQNFNFILLLALVFLSHVLKPIYSGVMSKVSHIYLSFSHLELPKMCWLELVNFEGALAELYGLGL